jgi:thymidylate kinase
MSERGRSLSPIEREFFANFFRRLDAAKIVSIYLRNYSGFPEVIGHDLDIFFRRTDLTKALDIFRETLRQSGGELVHTHQRDYVCAVWFRARRGEAAAIHLDFYHGAFTWHGLPYLEEKTLIVESVMFHNFKVPRPAHEASSLFLTSLLWGGFFKTRYREQIQSLLQAPQESTEFYRLLQREFGIDAKRMLTAVNERNDVNETIQDSAIQLRRSFRRRSFLRRPMTSMFRQIRFWLREFSTVLFPPGVCIAILGPDGSGKSTVIQAVKERIEYFFGEVELRHWRPGMLKDVGVLLKSREKTTGVVSNPHGRAPHSAVVSTLRLIYYWLDYWLGWPSRVLKPKAKNHLVVFDRYSQDMWCDPHRYRLRAPRSLLKLFTGFVPKPDLTFVLVADAETIHQRKGEVSPKVLRELLQRYNQLAQANPRIRAVDCRRPIKDIADEISAVVLDYLKSKVPASLKDSPS